MINLMGAVQIAALAEGIAMAEKLGLTADCYCSHRNQRCGKSTGCPVYPAEWRKRNLQKIPHLPQFRHKDAIYALELADKLMPPQN